MQVLIAAYNTVFRARYWRCVNKTAPVALCLMTKFNNLESLELDKTLLTGLKVLGFNTIALWIKPRVVKLKTEFEKAQELNLQLTLDWLIEKHVYCSSKWIIATSLSSALAINLIIRRPEITNYLIISPVIDADNLIEAKLLVRLRSLGMLILAENDAVSARSVVWQLIEFSETLKLCTLEFVVIKKASHLFAGKLNGLNAAITAFYSKIRA